MKNKKIIAIFIIVILIVSGAGAYYFFGRTDKNTTLTIAERQWIENNKNNIIDLGVINDVALLNYNGDGLFFEFLKELVEVTGIPFNKVPYHYGEKYTGEYALRTVDKVSKNDILIYTDSYAIIGKENTKYNRVTDIVDLTIGVLTEDIENATIYLDGSEDISFKAYETIEKMAEALEKENIDAMIMPKLIYLSTVRSEKPLYISYSITEMQDNYVLTLGNQKTLNNILKKYYKKWQEENYKKYYNQFLADIYFEISHVDEKEQVNFRSKSYNYGFIDNIPFDLYKDNKLIGYNSLFINDFAEVAGIEIKSKKYKNFDALLSDFNSNKIDFFFNIYNEKINHNIETFNTNSIYDEKIVILSKKDNPLIVNSISSLRESNVATLQATKVAEFLTNKKVKITEYDTADKLLKSKKPIIAIDYMVYEYYSNTLAVNYKIDYIYELNGDYTFTVRNVNSNELFSDFFNFYLGYATEKSLINNSYYDLISTTSETELIKTLAKYIGYSLAGIFALIVLIKLALSIRKNTKELSKEEKLKYIDVLTSLKNRNYLNDHIEEWDESEIYPRTVIIIDLNNIAYINDNYGHKEGDNVIQEAANILIKNQLPQSELIRTNGNEFLIYMFSQEEKQVVAYIRKLNKEFKDLSHGFGAAIGYSIIADAIKTTDDAINEATIDMRTNKEEAAN